MERLKRSLVRCAIVGVLFSIMVGPSVGRLLFSAEDDKKPSAKGDEADSGGKPAHALKVSDIPESTYVLPASTDPKTLLKFIKKINDLRPEFETEAQAEKFLATSRTAILEAANKTVQNNPTEKQRSEALQAKLEAYQQLVIVGVPNAFPKALKFAEELKADKSPALAEIGEAAWLDFKMFTIPNSGEKERRAIIDAVAAQLDKKPRNFIEFAASLGQMLEKLGDGNLAAVAYETFGNILAKNLDEQVRAQGEMMKNGSFHRARLLAGDPVKVAGTMVSGKPFDISAYKGKVVVVDFWATWCGPCREELPNLKALYQKYHPQGLEVVGISLDQEKAPLTDFLKENALPWTILFGADPKQSNSTQAIAEYYGVMGIPTFFVINREGKVVSVSARGEKINELVASLLGKEANAAKQSSE